MSKTYQCLLVEELSTGEFKSSVVSQNLDDLPPGEVLVKVQYSSLNYKDALSATGNKGVTRKYPHTPGIDAAGVIEVSDHPDWHPGDQVIITGFDLGMNTWGGFSEYVRVPAKWLVSLPEGLTFEESMFYGTAGFTAALSIDALIKNGITPNHGKIAVTGSTGGVGSVAISILHQLGYEVVAISGKTSSHDFLTAIGASEIISRAEMEDHSGKALLKPRFAGAVDTVGGEVLATLLKNISYGGTVTACGMVNGGALNSTVFPFIIRGIHLAGIDSSEYPVEKRAEIWRKLATYWKPDNLGQFTEIINLNQLSAKISAILEGKAQGRWVLALD
jgi:acrylyl-CoA reductase (NADPH)